MTGNDSPPDNTALANGDRVPCDPEAAAIDSPRRPAPRWSRARSVWRSPDDQPAWARAALLGIAAFAALLYALDIGGIAYSSFSSVAVKSMSVSWKAFFYGALDPGATITMDKLAGSFLPQALSARIFGFHVWALVLPQVIEGVVAVLVMYRVVRLWRGPAAGLLAAGLFTLTPVIASLFGHMMEDGLLIMCLVLAADAFQRALLRARLRSLILAGVWIGIGFQAKMLEAWMVLPAFVITYLLVAPTGWQRRLGQVAVAGVVTAVVSLSWVAVFTITPAQDRPYVDGSTSNSAFAMVFGYNGLGRFGIHLPGAANPITPRSGPSGPRQRPANEPSAGAAAGQTSGQVASGGGGGGSGGGGLGWVKLLGGDFGTQTGWLYPLAVLSLVLGLRRTRRAPRTDPTRAGLIMWGLWLLTFVVVYSKMLVPHTAYVGAIALPVVALSGAGIVMLWNGYRDGTARRPLPAAIVVQALWSIYLFAWYPSYLPWAIGITIAAALVSLAIFAARRLTGRVRHAVLTGGMVTGVVSMVAMPAIWSVAVTDPPDNGAAQVVSVYGNVTESNTASDPVTGTTSTLTAAQRRLDDYLTAHRDGAKFVAATDAWQTARYYITATGQPFTPMGGFTNAIPHPTVPEIRQLVSRGQLLYFLIGPSGSSTLTLPNATPAVYPVLRVVDWVKASCTKIPPANYGDTASTGTVYRCQADRA